MMYVEQDRLANIMSLLESSISSIEKFLQASPYIASPVHAPPALRGANGGIIVNTIHNPYLAQLYLLYQTSTVDEFQQQFDAIRTHVSSAQPELPEDFFTSLFINGLCPEVRTYVQGFHPCTVIDAYHVACIYEYNFSMAFTPNIVDTDVGTDFVETMLVVQAIPKVEHHPDTQKNECVSKVPISATAVTVNTCVTALSAFGEEQFSTSRVVSDVKDKIGSYPIDENLVMSISQPQLDDHDKVRDKGGTDVVDGTAFTTGNHSMARPNVVVSVDIKEANLDATKDVLLPLSVPVYDAVWEDQLAISHLRVKTFTKEFTLLQGFLDVSILPHVCGFPRPSTLVSTTILDKGGTSIYPTSPSKGQKVAISLLPMETSNTIGQILYPTKSVQGYGYRTALLSSVQAFLSADERFVIQRYYHCICFGKAPIVAAVLKGSVTMQYIVSNMKQSTTANPDSSIVTCNTKGLQFSVDSAIIFHIDEDILLSLSTIVKKATAVATSVMLTLVLCLFFLAYGMCFARTVSISVDAYHQLTKTHQLSKIASPSYGLPDNDSVSVDCVSHKASAIGELVYMVMGLEVTPSPQFSKLHSVAINIASRIADHGSASSQANSASKTSSSVAHDTNQAIVFESIVVIGPWIPCGNVLQAIAELHHRAYAPLQQRHGCLGRVVSKGENTFPMEPATSEALTIPQKFSLLWEVQEAVNNIICGPPVRCSDAVNNMLVLLSFQVFTKGVTALFVAIENVGMVLLLSTARSFKCCGNSFVEVRRVFTPSSITMLPTNRSMPTGFNYTTTLAVQIFQQQYPSVGVNAKHVTTLSNTVQGVRQLLLEALQHYVNVRVYMEPRDNIGHFLVICFDPGILMFICFMLYFSLARHVWVFERATVLKRLQVICELGVRLALLLMHSAQVLIRGKHTRLFSSSVLSMGAIQSEFYCCNYLYYSSWFLHFQFASLYIMFAWGSSCSKGMSCCCFRSANGIKKLRVLLPSSFWFCIMLPMSSSSQFVCNLALQLSTLGLEYTAMLVVLAIWHSFPCLTIKGIVIYSICDNSVSWVCETGFLFLGIVPPHSASVMAASQAMPVDAAAVQTLESHQLDFVVPNTLHSMIMLLLITGNTSPSVIMWQLWIILLPLWLFKYAGGHCYDPGIPIVQHLLLAAVSSMIFGGDFTVCWPISYERQIRLHTVVFGEWIPELNVRSGAYYSMKIFTWDLLFRPGSPHLVVLFSQGVLCSLYFSRRLSVLILHGYCWNYYRAFMGHVLPMCFSSSSLKISPTITAAPPLPSANSSGCMLAMHTSPRRSAT